MYIPKHFEVTHDSEVFAFIEANGFGQLISHTGSRLFATHIPFALSEDKTKLVGHLAKQNPQAEGLAGQELLITLQGPHDYISPSWYASPGVPTWNYQAVHIYGRCAYFSEPDALGELVESLTRKYESQFAAPWQPEYRPSMLGAIVGIEISISEIQCKYKLGQNRSSEDQEQVANQLENLGSLKLAKAMRRNAF